MSRVRVIFLVPGVLLMAPAIGLHRRHELAAARAIVRADGAGGGGGGHPLAYVTVFARASALDRLGVGPDAVSLGALARAADPGSGRPRLAGDSLDLVDSLSMLLP